MDTDLVFGISQYNWKERMFKTLGSSLLEKD